MTFDIRETAKEKVILCAHRGVWGGNIPCNIIPAYDMALRQGADMIEIDITKSADGELFIFHPGMEKRQICKDVNIRQMTAAEVRELRLCNYDGTVTKWGINTLDEVLEHFKGRCYINVDKFGDCPREIIECVKKHDMKEQIILKCSPKPEQLEIIETFAPDIQFLPIISADNGIHEALMHRNINYIGSELLFKSDDCELASDEYREKLHRDGKICWANSILYSYKAILAGDHSDDTALAEGNEELGWGWLADRFDIIQTDWVLALSTYLDKTGKRFRK